MIGAAFELEENCGYSIVLSNTSIIFLDSAFINSITKQPRFQKSVNDEKYVVLYCRQTGLIRHSMLV